MSGRHYRQSVHGSRIRKKSRRPLPLPKRPLPRQERRRDKERDDDDYVNLGHKHKLTFLRYPSGSGKRPPPKPKRVTAPQDVGSLPPQEPSFHPPPKPQPRLLKSPPPPTAAAAPKPQPRLSTLPKHQNSQDHSFGSKSSSPSRPLLPPSNKSSSPPRPLLPSSSSSSKSSSPPHPPVNRKLPRKEKSESPGHSVAPRGTSEGPPRSNFTATSEQFHPQCANPSSLDICPDGVRTTWNQGRLNGLINHDTPTNSTSSSSKPATPSKQPLLPPTMKPRKLKLKEAMEEEESSSLDFTRSQGDTIARSPQRRPPRPNTAAPNTAAGSLKRRPPPFPSTSIPDFMVKGYPPISPSVPHHTPLRHTTSSPDAGKSPAPRIPHLVSSPNLATAQIKAPLPKPRPRKQSRGDDSEATLSPTHLSGSSESDPRSPPPPVVAPRTNRETPSVPAQRGRNKVVVSSSVASLQILPNGQQQQKVSQTPPSLPTAKAKPPVPRKRANKPSPTTPTTALPTTGSRPVSLKKRKGGGIRLPLWQAPPPPTWTPPSSPAGIEAPRRDKRAEQRPSLALTNLQPTPLLSPPTSPVAMTSTSFILPPFRSSGMAPSPAPGPDLEWTYALDQEPPIQFSRVTSPTPSSPLTVDFEDSLFECKTVKTKPLFQQQHLPVSVVQELQNNLLRKQQVRR